MKSLIVTFTLLFLSGCATVPTTPIYETKTEFNIEDVSWIDDVGTASVKGNSFLRQQGGGVVTCAGAQVELIPAGAYADERIGAIYGSIFKGYKTGSTNIDKADPAYITATKNTVCDVDGRFKFEELAAGNYYVLSSVTWVVGHAHQGGYLMQRITLDDSETIEITMSQ